jgi:2-(1,2-epoxy-1,2-dihydrophenyl)acetyl-CoA isomerase
MADPDDKSLELTRADGVATITLRRPEARNALAPVHFARLATLCDEVAANPEDRVLVLTGEGEAFCAGADLTGSADVMQRLAQGPVARATFTRETTAAALALHNVPKPTIAAVNGVAAGGGCNLALDYAGTWLLPRLVGLQRAKDIAFRGNVLSSAEALELGLVLEVVPDEEVLGRVGAYARELAAKPPSALSLIKGGLNRATSLSFEEALAYEAEAQATCLGSQDFREAMIAWVKKRDGAYEGV